MVGSFHNPFSDMQDRPAVSHCHKCHTEIYPEDTCYLEGSFVHCESCGGDGKSMSGYELDWYFKKLYGD